MGNSLIVLLVVCCAPAVAAENLAPNPGMEEVGTVIDALGNELSVPTSWVSQTLPYCRVTEESAHVHAGQRALELPADAFLAKKVPVVYGDRYRITFWARGQGRLRAIAFEYDKLAGKPIWHTGLGAWELSEQWQECAMEYSPKPLLTERASRVPTDFIVNLTLRRPGKVAYVDDVVIKKIAAGDGKAPEGKTYWLPERVTALSSSESARADLVAQTDYTVPQYFQPAKVFGREFRFHLRADWFSYPWLAAEPMVKHAMIMGHWDIRVVLAFREMEVYDPEETNLARAQGTKLLASGWQKPDTLIDGRAPTDEKNDWWIENYRKDSCWTGGGFLPPDARIGVEFAAPRTVNRVVLHHGRQWNIDFLGEQVQMQGVASDFELEYSRDGKTWEPIPGTRVEGNDGLQTELDFEAVVAKSVRVHAWKVAPLFPHKDGNGWKRFHWWFREYVVRHITGPAWEEKNKTWEAYCRDVLRNHPWGVWTMTGFTITPLSPERERILGAYRKIWEPYLRDLKKQTGGRQYGGALYEWDHYTWRGVGSEAIVAYWRQAGLEPFTPAAWRSFWARQSEAGSAYYNGPSWLVANGSRPWVHWEALEDENLAVGEEFKGGYTSGHFQARLVMLRSAGRQYGKPWGVYSQTRLGLISQPGKSEFYHNYGKGGPGYDIGEGWYTGPKQGVSGSGWKRRIWGNYFAGENVQDAEFHSQAAVYRLESAHGNQGGMLNTQGRAMRDLGRLDEKLGSRGATYTPIALLLDYNAGWRDDDFRWQKRLYHEGDDEVNELLLTFFPVAGRNIEGIGYEVNNKDVADTPFGEIVDVLKPNLPGGVVAQEQFDAYKVLWMTGGWTPVKGAVGAAIDDAVLARRLATYVRNGGTLVLNAAYLKGAKAGPTALRLPEEFLGVKLTGGKSLARQAVFLFDDKDREPLESEPFVSYGMTAAEGTRTLAHTPKGDALMSLHKVGKGHVIVSGIEHNLTQFGLRIVPAAERLLRYLSEGITPFRIEGRCRWIVTARPDGWLLMLANNKGIYKDPQNDPEVDHLARVTLNITFHGQVQGLTELSQGYDWPFQVHDGKTTCAITVPAGDLRVLFWQQEN